MKTNADDTLIVVKTFSSAGEANIVKGLLKSFHIDCFLLHTDIAQMFPRNPSAGLQVQLLARKEDEERIKGILEAKFEPIE